MLISTVVNALCICKQHIVSTTSSHTTIPLVVCVLLPSFFFFPRVLSSLLCLSNDGCCCSLPSTVLSCSQAYSIKLELSSFCQVGSCGWGEKMTSDWLTGLKTSGAVRKVLSSPRSAPLPVNKKFVCCRWMSRCSTRAILNPPQESARPLRQLYGEYQEVNRPALTVVYYSGGPLACARFDRHVLCRARLPFDRWKMKVEVSPSREPTVGVYFSSTTAGAASGVKEG